MAHPPRRRTILAAGHGTCTAKGRGRLTLRAARACDSHHFLAEVFMRSKAQVKGHPIHPMLVAFPIAFLSGSFLFDLFGRLGGWSSAWTTGAYLNLAAIASGLIAGVPGLVDYLFAVPPSSSGKTRATYHMIVNVSALGCFAVSWAFRETSTWLPGTG